MIIGAVSMGRALLRLPVIAWHLGRGGVLGPIATIGLLPGWLRWLCASLDRLVRSRRAASDTGAALCAALARLGPGFVKFGQALSTRSDLIGPALGQALARLQDRMPPFAAAKARKQIEHTHLRQGHRAPVSIVVRRRLWS